MNKPNPKKSRDPHVGRFFLSIELNKNSDGPPKREIGWQGLVVEKRLRGHYLVQLFDWLTGGPSDQLLVPRDDMTGWQFYDSGAEMRAYYEDYAHRNYRDPLG